MDRAWLSSAGCRQGWAAPIPDPQRPRVTGWAGGPHFPQLPTPHLAVRSPPTRGGTELPAPYRHTTARAPVPRSLPAVSLAQHWPTFSAPWDPSPRPQSQPLPAAAGLPQGARPRSPVGAPHGDTGRVLSTALSGRGCTVPGGGGRPTGLGEVKSGPILLPPPPRASLSASRAAPSRRAVGFPSSLPSRHPFTSHRAPGALGAPSWESGVPWSLAPGQPSLHLRGPLWRMRRGGRLAWALQPLQYQPVSAQGF